MDDKWYHGGAPNLKNIKPPLVTGAPSCADYGASGVTKRNKIYCTRNFDEALIFAAMYPLGKGMVYQVIPEGEIADDPDYTGQAGNCIECDSATVIRRFKLSGKMVKKIQRAMLES